MHATPSCSRPVGWCGGRDGRCAPPARLSASRACVSRGTPCRPYAGLPSFQRVGASRNMLCGVCARRGRYHVSGAGNMLVLWDWKACRGGRCWVWAPGGPVGARPSLYLTHTCPRTCGQAACSALRCGGPWWRLAQPEGRATPHARGCECAAPPLFLLSRPRWQCPVPCSILDECVRAPATCRRS